MSTESSGGNLAGPGKRVGAFVIDTVLTSVATAVLMVVPLLLLVGVSDPTGGGVDAGFMLAVLFLFQLVVLVLFYGYFIVLEAMYGYTAGKKLLGIRVVGESGGDIGWKAATIRNLLLIVDNLPFAYLLGLGLILYDDDEQRLGDMAADTYVVSA